MQRKLLLAGTILGFLGVALGAFAAHGLKARLDPEMLTIWETGVRYQMYHALALLATGWAAERFPGKPAAWAGGLFIAGVLLFSGSLYALALTGVRTLGAVTPFGGVALLAGWVMLSVAVARR
jgi:uncharacterized membrane protein YgdD (TMEM256/DUF423 family)